MTRRTFGQLGIACLLVGAGPVFATAQPAGKGPPVDFSRDILPILSANCYTCHGPDQKARKAGLRLDLAEAATRKLKSGSRAVVPGDPNKSELIARIFTDDPDERMPPPKTLRTLSDRDKELLRTWIDQGAEFKLHWSFIKPVRPRPPEVKDKAWIINDIDRFILARLETAGIKPSPPADRPTLVRRLSLDLRGLPPTLAEVDEFLVDKSDDAYAKLVDRMLASPRFGEKMAQLWLDLARFGDTSGYNQDSTRQMWLWRDGVIDAFNKNMPFDRFTIEQLAGDLLPDATVATRIASGFNRLGRYNEEDGACPEESFSRSDADRANTLGQVWLGLTLGCVECHDHKYDPISHKEYYQLYAFFSGIEEPTSGFKHDQPLPPTISLASPEQEAALKNERAELASTEKAIAGELKRITESESLKDRLETAERAWEAQLDDPIKLPIEVREALVVGPAMRSNAQKKVLRDFYVRTINPDTRGIFQTLNRELEQIQKRVQQSQASIPHAMVSEELKKPRPAYVLFRGDFQQKGEKVGRGVPAVFPPMPKDAPNNRLGLAKWLVHPDHPLTARVAANRLWAQMFGSGIVRTIGDFGSQGDYPSHPELLDWLATDFVRTGWHVKGLLKTIAMSNTYRQSSAHRMEKTDPANRLLYCAPRFRLSAEEIRDNALAVSGLLSKKIGGPSVMPYQPATYYVGKFEGWNWQTSQDEQQYRRGLYTFWRRSALHPMFAIFDAPTREECAVARPRTNTPLQALVTLNDPTFVEAARVFAQQLLETGPADLDGRLKLAFRTTLARVPAAAELDVLRTRYQQHLKHYQAHRDAAEQLVNAGTYPRPVILDVAEHAAWTTVASMLLNLDETITRE